MVSESKIEESWSTSREVAWSKAGNQDVSEVASEVEITQRRCLRKPGLAHQLDLASAAAALVVGSSPEVASAVASGVETEGALVTEGDSATEEASVVGAGSATKAEEASPMAFPRRMLRADLVAEAVGLAMAVVKTVRLLNMPIEVVMDMVAAAAVKITVVVPVVGMAPAEIVVESPAATESQSKVGEIVDLATDRTETRATTATETGMAAAEAVEKTTMVRESAITKTLATTIHGRSEGIDQAWHPSPPQESSWFVGGYVGLPISASSCQFSL